MFDFLIPGDAREAEERQSTRTALERPAEPSDDTHHSRRCSMLLIWPVKQSKQLKKTKIIRISEKCRAQIKVLVAYKKYGVPISTLFSMKVVLVNKKIAEV